ncbi:MAG: translation initiation factor IF-2 subunit gamma [Candidatus Parvarchaeota archaeon]|nr:translation initiation factor IF-2 subunit gamma [Candidatus Parvarchaeota archaeon]MCW1301573.1 translation initiation factor IF-2 subunit gamma [Candidatus Parvarchaeota archaeon]
MVEDIIVDLVGNFADGKTTLVKALTNESALRHSEEKKRGITIRLGYAHFKLFKCNSCGKFSRFERCEFCGGSTELFRRVSIIDSPGHRMLMTTMLSGIGLADGAIMVISAINPCPQPQTEEHMEAINLLGIKNLVVAQTKVDLAGESKAKENYNQIRAFLEKNGFSNTNIIPTFANQNINIQEIIQEIGKFDISNRDVSGKPKMQVIRSFDVNKPGTRIEDLKGGVLGGGLVSGRLSVGDEVVLTPNVSAGSKFKSIRTKIMYIQSEFGEEKSATRGLSIGVLTKLDPSIVRRDALVGSLITDADNLPILDNKLRMTYDPIPGKTIFDKPLQKGESILINVLSSRAIGIIQDISKGGISLVLGEVSIPFFTGDKVIVSRKVKNAWTLAGSGIIL